MISHLAKDPFILGILQAGGNSGDAYHDFSRSSTDRVCVPSYCYCPHTARVMYCKIGSQKRVNTPYTNQ